MYKYLIIIEKANGNYSAYSPDLPGCIAVGDTIEETKEKMKSAIEFHIEGLKAEGLPIPEPKTISEYLSIVI
jgi:predicted RNase H-like HicB family nuclease